MKQMFAARRRMSALAALAAGCLAFAAVAAQAQAQDAARFPERPVKLVVPFPAGGATDAVARLVGQQLSAAWGQAVIIDNKPGAGTVIGTDAVAKAPADGYTIGMVVTAHAINPSLRSRLPYDTLKDFAAVSQIGVQHLVMAANPRFEAGTVEELLALARRKPGQITYATPGSGTAMHLAVELLNTVSGVQLVHVPYKGGAPAQQDVIGGQVPLLLDVYHSAAPFIRSGRLKAIAMLSPQRIGVAPDVPVVAETAPAVSALSTIGVVAPAGTPRAIVARISADIAAALRKAEVGGKLAEMGVEPVGSAPEAYDALIRAEIVKWAPVVKSSGAVVD